MTALKYTYSYETEAEARLRGELFLAKMGPIWDLKVWENLGWHYSLRTENLGLSEYGGRPDNRRTYSVLVGEHGAGQGHWTFNRKEPCFDPWEALGIAIGQARSVVERDLKIVHAAEATLLASMDHHERLVRGSTH